MKYKYLKFLLLIISITLICIIFRNEIHFKYIDIRTNFIEKELIFWNKNLKIEKKDYQGEVVKSSKYPFVFTHSLYIKATDKVKVSAVFNKDKSWIKENTNYDIECEDSQKLIFDLMESFARKCNNEISSLNKDERFFDNYNKIVEENYNQYLKLEKEMYYIDNINKRKKIWQPKIDSMLTKYKIRL